jgi:hypothetical protein
METLTLHVPIMYGDHHVSEVRRILLEIPGVENVYASSCFQLVEVIYDSAQIDGSAITFRLDKAGYLGDLAAPLETGDAVAAPDKSAAYFRHTIAYQQTGRVIGFAQDVSHTGRALWPCPGMEAGMESMKNQEGSDGEERA